MSWRRKWRLLHVALLVVVLLTAGCGGAASNSQPEQQPAPAENGASTSAFPLTITDASGAEIHLEKAPERLVSLAPSNTENAFALGLGSKVVGVTDWDNYPEEVKEIEKIGGLEPNIEKILSLEPDLVIAHVSANNKSIQPLRDAGLKVLALPDSKNFDGVYEALRMLGKATGTQDKAEEVIQQMEQKKAAITAKVADLSEKEKVKVWVEVSPDLYTAGRGTFIDDLIRLAGGINVAAEEEGWVQLSEEQVIAAQPDVIITTYGGYETEKPSEQIRARKAWADLPAVKENRIYDLNSDLVSRPGPRLVEGLEQVAKCLYPERF